MAEASHGKTSAASLERREPADRFERAHRPQLAGPAVEVGRERRIADRAHLPSVLEEPPRLGRPVLEVGTSPEQRDTPYARVGRRHRQTK